VYDSNGSSPKNLAPLASIDMIGATRAQVLSLQEEVDELKRQRKEVVLMVLHPEMHVAASAYVQTPETQTSPPGGRGAGRGGADCNEAAGRQHKARQGECHVSRMML
jgi:hypothetical protein